MNTYVIDFEFNVVRGELVSVWCVSYYCLETEERTTLWLDGTNLTSPFPDDFIMVAHYAMAELGCFHTLGWPRPTFVIDTLSEARVLRGQVKPPGGSWSLISICDAYGITTLPAIEKDKFRQIAIAGEVALENQQILMDYCAKDVEATKELWLHLKDKVSLPLAKLRGRYLQNLIMVELNGIPVDTNLLDRLTSKKDKILECVWEEAKNLYPGVISPDGKFSAKAWVECCEKNGVVWPLHPSRQPKLDSDTFGQMAKSDERIRVMADARKLRGQRGTIDFPVGKDSRTRTMLAPFSSDTGRNQPSTTKFVFGASAWLRSIIKAPLDSVLAYIDFSAQEYALAAYLSKDVPMLEDYKTGDPYLAFAKRAGAVPDDATKATHSKQRGQYKIAALGVQYGMREKSLASTLGIQVSSARMLIKEHQQSYPAYWAWRQSVVDHVMCRDEINTRFGWRRKLKPQDRSTSIANFLVQASGAEILQIAIIALVEAGHKVIAPIHDAVVVELPQAEWRKRLSEVEQLMAKAVDAVAPGLVIPTDVDLVAPGTNYIDSRGEEFWDLISPVVGSLPVRTSPEMLNV